MLGEHFGGAEDALLVELALGHDALAFGEEVGEDALVLDGNDLGGVGDAEGDGHAVGLALDAAGLDHAAEPERAARRGFLRGHLRGREEEDEVFIECLQGERHAGADGHDGRADEGEFLGLRVHGLHLQRRFGCTGLAGEASADLGAAGAQGKDFVDHGDEQCAVGAPNEVAVAVHVDEVGKTVPVVHSLPSKAASLVQFSRRSRSRMMERVRARTMPAP